MAPKSLKIALLFLATISLIYFKMPSQENHEILPEFTVYKAYINIIQDEMKSWDKDNKDLKVYVKYESILEKAGIKGEIIGMKTIEGVSNVTVRKGTTAFSVVKPKNLKVVQVRLENGTVINVTLLNIYGAKLASPGNDVVEVADSEGLGKGITAIKGDIRAVTPSGEVPLNSNLVVPYSSADVPDGEIRFVVTTNDPDLIPFYREIKLNRELEANGFTARFDPTDKNNADLNGDYDGDGVPNSVELFIGKNPALRDVLGVHLNISIEWNASEDKIKAFIKSFQRASQVVYDYTDGYALITEISIKNNVPVDSEEWKDYMIRMTLRTNITPKTIHGLWYWKWVKNLDRKEEGYILFPWNWFNGPLNKGWYGGMAHELGHFVFGIGDEYGAPFYWNPNNDSKMDGFTYNDLKNPLASKYGIEFEKMTTVMEAGDLWTEISTLKDYVVFKEQLENVSRELEEKTGYGLLELIVMYGGPKFNTLDSIMPTHWQSEYWIDGVPQVHESAWGVVFALLVEGHILGHHYVYDIDAGLYLDLNFDGNEDAQFPANYTAKTGPYTGVGYYMIVNRG